MITVKKALSYKDADGNMKNAGVLCKLAIPSKELELCEISKSDFVNGLNLDKSTGEIVEGSANHDTTGKFIKVDSGRTIFVRVNGITHVNLPYNAICIIEYGEDYSLVKSTEIPQPDLSDYTAFLALQESTKYIRIRINFLTASTTESTVSTGYSI